MRLKYVAISRERGNRVLLIDGSIVFLHAQLFAFPPRASAFHATVALKYRRVFSTRSAYRSPRERGPPVAGLRFRGSLKLISRILKISRLLLCNPSRNDIFMSSVITLLSASFSNFSIPTNIAIIPSGSAPVSLGNNFFFSRDYL